VRFALALVLVACGSSAPSAIDATPDTGADPFAGHFELPSDLPRDGCVPGSLDGFSHVGYWPALAMRITRFPELAVHLAGDRGDDVRAEHVLTADDLFVRAVEPIGATWQLRAIVACAVEPDGTLRGSEVRCLAGEPCLPRAISAARLARAPGEAEAAHLRLLGELAWPTGATVAVRVHLSTAFVARRGDGLRVVSITNPRAPIEIAAMPDPDIADLELVRGVDGRRYLVTAGGTSRVIEIDNPRAPRIVGVLAADTRAVTVDGTAAFLVDARRLAAVDLSDPRRPVAIGSVELPDARGVFAAGGLVYTASDTGLHVIDARTGPPRLLATADAPAHAAALASLAGRSLVVALAADRLAVLEGSLASPAFLAPLGAWAARPLVPLAAVHAAGSRAYVAAAREGVRVLDLADPSAPGLVGHAHTWRDDTGGAGPREAAVGIAIDRAVRRVYVADSIRGLLIFEGDAAAFP
jgi:hypothetical protein